MWPSAGWTSSTYSLCLWLVFVFVRLQLAPLLNRLQSAQRAPTGNTKQGVSPFILRPYAAQREAQTSNPAINDSNCIMLVHGHVNNLLHTEMFTTASVISVCSTKNIIISPADFLTIYTVFGKCSPGWHTSEFKINSAYKICKINKVLWF